MSNLRHWQRFDDIDPKFTKPITGKAYKGTSPNPQYVIRCLTEIFGPVGQGFGWDVVAEEFTPLGPEVLHWCRIRFWHTSPEHGFDAYGQTKAVYTAGSGKVMVDEDAPKKSLTDAIVKAASQVGIGANIFMGRWDDQKYVAEVAAEYRAEERKAKPGPVPVDHPRGPSPADIAITSLTNAETLDQLAAIWRDLGNSTHGKALQALPEVKGAKDNRKAELAK